MTRYFRNAQHGFRNYFLFDRFQFAFATAMERDHSAAQGRHQPGGCQTMSQRELSP
jgi:hypothetical protein